MMRSSRRTPTVRPQRVKTSQFTFFLVPEYTHIAFSCALEPLRIANLVSGKDLFAWTPASEDGHTATCSNGSATLTGAGM